MSVNWIMRALSAEASAKSAESDGEDGGIQGFAHIVTGVRV